MTNWETAKEEVRRRTRIEDVVRERVDLIRQGNLWVGFCPFHDDKVTPNLTVYPDADNPHYYCFACKAYGDVFTWLMEMERMTFIEALTNLAARVGIDHPTFTPKDREHIQTARAIEDILTETAHFYHSQLTDSERAYLHARGVADDSIDRFLIGYAPGHSTLKKHLMAKGYSLDLCYQAGVLKEKVDRSDGTEGSQKIYPVDFYYIRITCPYVVRGRVRGMVARAVEAGEVPKYLGLPLPKDHLYNESALGHRRVVAVEGPFDCIIAEQHGYHAVALVGTTLKAEHVSKFSRCDAVFVAMDPDTSGEDAALDIADMLRGKARIVSLPTDTDPDEYLMQYGQAAFDALLDSAPDVICYLLDRIPPSTGKVELTKELDLIIRRLAREPKHVAEAYLTDNIKKRFRLTREDMAGYREHLNACRKEGSSSDDVTVATDLPREFTASFEGLVDLVEQDGAPAFLIEDPESGIFKVATQWPGSDDGKLYVPPPIEQIPWMLSNGQGVLEHIERASTRPTSEVDRELFEDLKLYHKGVSELPAEEYYDLLAAFDLHTYLLEQFQYSPILNLFADPEKGKTKTAKASTYVSYRAVHIESLREASILRYASNLKATLFFDVRDLWTKAEKQGSDDIILLRFERGAKVARVLYPDRGAFQDTVYYEIFGPTIIATNEAVDRILETRAISVSMPETSRKFEEDITPEAALPLKERMVAFRARHKEVALPECDKPAAGRLGDILKPLLQVLMVVRPERVPRFMALVQHLKAARLVEKAETLEARIIRAVDESKGNIENNILSVEAILSVLNTGRSEKYWFKSESIGKRLKGLGFEKTRTSDGHAAVVWDAAFVQKLCVKYGLDASAKPSELSDLTPVQWPDAPAVGKPEGSEGSEGFQDVYVEVSPAPAVSNGNGKSHPSPGNGPSSGWVCGISGKLCWLCAIRCKGSYPIAEAVPVVSVSGSTN